MSPSETEALPQNDVRSTIIPRAAPRDKGVNSALMGSFLDEAGKLGVELNSVMMWRAGAVVAEGWWWPYQNTLRHMMHSATKSFLSTAIGFAVEEGLIALDDNVLSFFPEHAPGDPSDHLASMTIADLLTQTSGHSHGTSGSQWRSIPTSWIAEFLKIGVPYPPGAKFRYSSATSFMLSAIITKVTGDNVHAYLEPRLFEPLGISDLQWDLGPENINPGGNGISARSEDLLKLAILHLRDGMWNDRLVLPSQWVRDATSAKRGNPYGYHWWIGPGGCFYAYGVFGQFAFVFPQHDAILVTTAATPYGEETLRSLVWHYFPALFEAPLAKDAAAADSALETRLASLRLLPVPEASCPSRQDRISGVTYVAEPNADQIEWIRLTFDNGRCLFAMKDHRGEHVVTAGLDDWIDGSTTISGSPLHHGYEPDSMAVVAGGRWTDTHRFEMTWQFTETAFQDTVVVAFDDKSGLTFERSVNTNSMSPVRPLVIAHAQPPER